MYLSDSVIESRYPEQKPICFNYAAARQDILAFREENTRLEKRLAAFEEGLSPDVAEQFSKKADSLLTSMNALLRVLDAD
jgi:hypothetical protein